MPNPAGEVESYGHTVDRTAKKNTMSRFGTLVVVKPLETNFMRVTLPSDIYWSRLPPRPPLCTDVSHPQAATMITNDRQQEKESMAEFIAKKREMFLVQMSLDTKREEIRKLEEKARMKEEALRKSEQARVMMLSPTDEKVAREALTYTHGSVEVEVLSSVIDGIFTAQEL